MSTHANLHANLGESADRELVVSRTFDAPRELVWKAWTDPNHVGNWWGPFGFTTTIHEMEVRPGGVWRYIMHGPDGVDYDNRMAFIEVVEPERLVYWHDADKDDDPDRFHVTVTFAAIGNQTELTMRSLFASAIQRDAKVRFGAVEGARQTLTRLAEYLPTM